MRRDDSTTRDVADKTESSRTLPRRPEALKHWRWMPGMLCEGVRIEAIAKGGNPLDSEGYVPVGGPDLSDPATLGCIEHVLLPEAWGPDAIIQVARYGDRAAVLVLLRESCEIAHQTGNETTPAGEALVCALEAAPA